MTVNISRAEKLNTWINRLVGFALITLAGFIAILLSNEALLELPGVNLVLAIAFICIAVSALLMVFFGNALDRFGPKYLLVMLLVPIVGFPYSLIRLKGHLRQARLDCSPSALSDAD